MIRTLIIEDEKPALDRIRGFLATLPDIEILDSTDSGKIAAALIDELKPDLIFLDIHLSDISGIDLFHLISYKPLVIFTTAYNQYAIRAFELQAIDYLLKPFSLERLKVAVNRAKETLDGNLSSEKSIKNLLSQWSPQKDYLKRIPSKIGDRIYIINEDKVVYFASDQKLVFAHLEDTKYLVNYKLEELNARLDPEKFFRIHRSTIVNLNYVQTIEAWFGGGYKMKVRDKQKTELTISRAAGKLLRQKLGW
ncbi:MAG: response regulator transcription factor [Calditrichia bacterium]|nr:response regulator transcription factor [Calditrichia bacterium]